jgi:hypothetical protein
MNNEFNLLPYPSIKKIDEDNIPLQRIIGKNKHKTIRENK